MREDKDTDLKIERCGDSYKVTNLSSNEETTHKVQDFKFEYSSLITFDLDGQK